MEPRYGAMSRDFQSFTGPGDRDLPMTEISGYQPVSRIGEIVMNAFGARPPHSKPQPHTQSVAALPVVAPRPVCSPASQSTRTSLRRSRTS
ncbi:MAG: hypothetical protein ACKVI4_14405 [Actinomycetales bacterium]